MSEQSPSGRGHREMMMAGVMFVMQQSGQVFFSESFFASPVTHSRQVCVQ